MPAEFAEHCHVVRVRAAQATAQQIRTTKPDAIVFDFDYPDKMSLGMAAKLKEENPSVPMVLLSVQHSEALAVWAFRSRFFDFLTRPVAGADVERCLGLLEDISLERRSQVNRHVPFSTAPIPAEVPAAMGNARALQPAVQFVENNLGSRIVAQREFTVPSDIRFVQVLPTTGQPVLPWGPRGVDVALREAQMQSLRPFSGSREPSPTGGGP